MRTMSWLMCVAVAGLLTGCASVNSVKMQVDTGPITAHTFSFVARNPRSGVDLPVNEEKVHAMFQEAITGNLAAKGVNRVDAAGDIVVAYLIIVGDGTITTYLDRYFGFDSDAPELMDQVHDRSVKQRGRNVMVAGTLVIDILDAKASKLLKRRTVQSEILRDVSMETRVVRLQAVVDEALSDLKIVR